MFTLTELPPIDLFLCKWGGFSMTHLSPVQYWFIQSYRHVYIHNWVGRKLH